MLVSINAFFPGRIQGCFDALEKQYVSFFHIFLMEFPIPSQSMDKVIVPFLLYRFVVILRAHNTCSQLWDRGEDPALSIYM